MSRHWLWVMAGWTTVGRRDEQGESSIPTPSRIHCMDVWYVIFSLNGQDLAIMISDKRWMPCILLRPFWFMTKIPIILSARYQGHLQGMKPTQNPCYVLSSNHQTLPFWCRDHFAYAPSQWETTLQYNVTSHWLGTHTKRSLLKYQIME